MANKNWMVNFLLALVLSTGALAQADTVRLAPDHPDRYVVIRGDTLWDISARFLEDPWMWPEIWHINPEIANPHLIYPGDIIRLDYVDGRPVLRLERPGPAGLQRVKLSPSARVTDLESAIPTIPIDAIGQFLKYPRIVSEKELERSGYIVASNEDRLISGSGNRVYARGIDGARDGRYQIVRRGEVYRDPADRREILGYEALNVGYARVTRGGDPATVLITESEREVLPGDRLIPIEEDRIDQYFLPRAPDTEVEGQILSVIDGLARIGTYQVVAISRGARDGLEAGHVLAVHQTGEVVSDKFAPWSIGGRSVRLPNERAGTLMLIRVFDRVSYALVMEAERDLRLYDTVTRP